MTAQTLTHRLSAAWARMSEPQRIAFVVHGEDLAARQPVPAMDGDAPDDVPRPPVVVVRGGYRPRAVS